MEFVPHLWQRRSDHRGFYCDYRRFPLRTICTKGVYFGPIVRMGGSALSYEHELRSFCGQQIFNSFWPAQRCTELFIRARDSLVSFDSFEFENCTRFVTLHYLRRRFSNVSFAFSLRPQMRASSILEKMKVTKISSVLGVLSWLNCSLYVG